jgi:hypothetical protein
MNLTLSSLGYVALLRADFSFCLPSRVRARSVAPPPASQNQKQTTRLPCLPYTLDA